MKSGGQGTWWKLGWNGSRGNDIYFYGLEFFNVRSHKIKQKQRKKGKEEKPNQKSKSGPLGLSDRMGLLPRRGRSASTVLVHTSPLGKYSCCCSSLGAEGQGWMTEVIMQRCITIESLQVTPPVSICRAGLTEFSEKNTWIQEDNTFFFSVWFVSMTPKTLFKCFSFSLWKHSVVI